MKASGPPAVAGQWVAVMGAPPVTASATQLRQLGWRIVKVVLQRVIGASVRVDGDVVGQIQGPGLLALVGVSHDDTVPTSRALATKVANLRIMREERSVLDIGGSVLVVSQFTLYGDTGKGRRPSWTAAARGEQAEPLVDAFAQCLREHGIQVATGRFGADMAVELLNDGPVTLIIES